MGWAICTGHCWSCGKIFGFNPNRVPSIRDKNGVRQPVCRTCMDKANEIRVQRGEKPFAIPDDAYEPVDESEL